MKVTYEMPSFTTREAAIAMAKPHGLKLRCFQDFGGWVVAMFVAPNERAIAEFSADLSYGPVRS